MSRTDVEKVLVAGGGVAALEAALTLRELLGNRVRVELLAPEPQFWYRPVAVAEPFGLGTVRHFELAELAERLSATFTLGSLRWIDDASREVRTATGQPIPYDALLVACGAVPTPAVPGALTFRGPADVAGVERILEEIESGDARSLAFAVPRGPVWPLPAYELALLSAARLHAHGVHGAVLALVTPESQPLELFGAVASGLVRDLLEERNVTFHAEALASGAGDGKLYLRDESSVPADRAIALPRLAGPPLDGVPQTAEGFVPVDPHCRVPGLERVFAAGDVTSYRVKQGGIAAQQARAAAESIAALVDPGLRPHPFRPVLRGLLLTGGAPRYLRREREDATDAGWASETPLWWPPAKIVGRHLPGFLADAAGVERPPEPPAHAGVPVEVELDAEAVDHVVLRVPSTAGDRDGSGPAATARDVMTPHPLVVEHGKTLASVAAEMQDDDVGSALVVDEGRLVGILTSRDLLRALAAGAEASVTLARTWMTAEPVAVEPDTDLDALEELMADHGIHHLPVVEEGRPVGMVGLRDVTRARADRPPPIGLGL
jgi:sulfide:quinone oxidoreductase